MIDPPEVRPGIPMASEPNGRLVERDEPEPQPGVERHLRRSGLDEPTAVFGTAQPPHGLSGMLRRRAYRIPERFARHWMLLLLADRVDVLEDRLGTTLAEPLVMAGWTGGSQWVRGHPFRALGALVVGAWMARRAARGVRR